MFSNVHLVLCFISQQVVLLFILYYVTWRKCPWPTCHRDWEKWFFFIYNFSTWAVLFGNAASHYQFFYKKKLFLILIFGWVQLFQYTKCSNLGSWVFQSHSKEEEVRDPKTILKLSWWFYFEFELFVMARSLECCTTTSLLSKPKHLSSPKSTQLRCLRELMTCTQWQPP